MAVWAGRRLVIMPFVLVPFAALGLLEQVVVPLLRVRVAARVRRAVCDRECCVLKSEWTTQEMCGDKSVLRKSHPSSSRP